MVVVVLVVVAVVVDAKIFFEKVCLESCFDLCYTVERPNKCCYCDGRSPLPTPIV